MSRRFPLAFGSLVVSNAGFPTLAEVPHAVISEVRALALSARGRDELARLLDLGPAPHHLAERVLEALSRGQLVYEAWAPSRSAAQTPDVAPNPSLAELAGDEPEDLVLHAVVLELVDGDDLPVPRAEFRLIDPEGRTHEGRLDHEGRAEVEGIRKPGACKVCFPEFDQSSWDYIHATPL